MIYERIRIALVKKSVQLKSAALVALCSSSAGEEASSWVWNLLPFPLQFQSPSIKNALKRNFFSYRRITPSTGPTGDCRAMPSAEGIYFRPHERREAEQSSATACHHVRLDCLATFCIL